jgi:hypothetical protein
VHLGAERRVRAVYQGMLEVLQRSLSEDDDDESSTFKDLPSGERVTIVFVTIISLALCLYFCYYIRCRKELPSDRIPLTAGR